MNGIRSAFPAFFPTITGPQKPSLPNGELQPWFQNPQVSPGISTDRINILDFGSSNKPGGPRYVFGLRFIQRPILFLSGASTNSVAPRLSQPGQNPNIQAQASQSLANFQNTLYQIGSTGNGGGL